jgi:hypothetical protein
MEWWLQAGGFDIAYPNYDWYENEATMFARILEQNKLILDFGQHFQLQWTQHPDHSDIFMATYRGQQ